MTPRAKLEAESDKLLAAHFAYASHDGGEEPLREHSTSTHVVCSRKTLAVECHADPRLPWRL
ncbi:hypothetical protein FCK90_13295 [Kocuria coralli]|uniref:Uncharacterized protein n=1 Tax=Kocuria coralli TaxID=1461025 RepID=A0A5J5KU40_9MICC|nr:hypothetical protein FCK90_13295 [Kocuria coralli]